MPLSTRPHLACAVAALLLTLSCGDFGPTGDAVEARVLGENVLTLNVGETGALAIACLDKAERTIKGAPVVWGTFQDLNSAELPGRIALDWRRGRARIRGISAGRVYVRGVCGDRNDFDLQSALLGPTIQFFRVEVLENSRTNWTLDPSVDTVRLRVPSPDDSISGVTHLLTVRSTLAGSAARSPLDFQWSSDNAAIASVSSEGLVRATGLGATTIRINGGRGSNSASIPVRVDATAGNGSWDIALVDAHWTQGAQDSLQRVPIVRNGRAAVLNVTAYATPGAPASAVLVDVWDAEGRLIWNARTALVPTLSAVPSFATPSAQILVPRVVVRAAARWRVTRDTVGAPDANRANDVLPRTGAAALNAVTAPPLRLRLVPVRLAAHDNVMTPLSPVYWVNYDSIPRIRLPIGEVTISVEPPVTLTSEMPIDATSEKGRQLYYEMLEAVDKRRLASSSGREDYWVGLMPKHTASARAAFGGIAYIPMSPTETGPMSRSMLVLGQDWYASWVQASSTVSHELGHNFGLRHAPCGDASGLDPAYPIAGGGVGSWVHWVSAWEHGTASFAETIEPTSGDFMGYCSGSFVSPYHMRAMIEWRTLADASLRQPAASVPVITVRGVITDAGITLRRPEITTGEPELGGGTVEVELLAADGRVLYAGSAQTGRLSDGSAVPFTAILPLASAWEGEVARVRVRAGRQQAAVAVVRVP